MKLPFVSTQNNNIKQQVNVRRSPPRSIAGKASEFTTTDHNSVVFTSSDDQLPLDHGMVHQFEEWDSLMRDLGLHDDSAKPGYPLDLPELPPIHTESAPAPTTTMIAECFETRSIQLAQVILARLNQRLHAPNGKPLQRAAFYFKEALQSLLTGPTRTTQSSTSSEIIQAIKAYKTFSNVSPIPMFSDFTANQAMLEAVDGAMIVHVIDFDIGLGGHLASFMKEIAEKAEARKIHSPAVRITAVVPEEYETESKLIRDNLWQFARGLKLRFDIEFVSFRTFEYLSFKSIKFMEGEKTAVLLSSTVFHKTGPGFINDLRRITPNIIVIVDSEGVMGGEPSFFRQTVIDGLEFYSTVLESLEAANVGGGGGSDWMRKIEMFVMLPKITAAVEASGRQVPPWREVFARAGIRAVGMSQFADFQAECLLRRVQVRGFHVVKRQAEMVLCWHDRPLVATSAWRF
ncbi:GRAS protein [Artemisia annua]|uniref:GRAS protein n=1 Tax=Artemisia annua TaxID=35608 RepID=A0A2U1N8H0_ARTAN|nr:GRAS protein [Artemisia annua]PWA89164.1 GRAS protein [Artemisia annua]